MLLRRQTGTRLKPRRLQNRQGLRPGSRLTVVVTRFRYLFQHSKFYVGVVTSLERRVISSGYFRRRRRWDRSAFQQIGNWRDNSGNPRISVTRTIKPLAVGKPGGTMQIRGQSPVAAASHAIILFGTGPTILPMAWLRCESDVSPFPGSNLSALSNEL